MSVPEVRTTFVSQRFSVAAFSVWNSLPSGIRAYSSSHTICPPLNTVFFSRRPSAPPSGSHKCFRFGLWLTLGTIKDFICLLTDVQWENTLDQVISLSNSELNWTELHNFFQDYWHLARDRDIPETIELRQLHLDLIFCYKIVFGLVSVNFNDYFEYNFTTQLLVDMHIN